MKKVWHPSSLRVKRLSDGKIFTCSVAAARNLGLQVARQIEDACNGYLSQVAGSKWEWEYSEPVLDFGDFNDLVSRVNRKLGVSSKRESRHSYSTTGKAMSRSVRQKCFDVVEFFRKNTATYERMTLVTEIHAAYKEYCKENSLYIQFFTPISFARHLKSWYLLYFRAVGLLFTEGKLTVKPYQKRLFFCVDPNLADPNFSIYDEIPEYKKEIPLEEKTFSKKAGNRGFPVYCPTTNTTYTSIKEASKATGITPSDIKFCCSGDLPHVRLKGKNIEFQYGKWENVDASEFIRKYNLKTTTGRQVLEINSGTIFKSITAAAIFYGISRVAITEYCNRENPDQGEGFVVRNLGRDLMTVKFMYSDTEEEESWDDVLRSIPITE